MRPSFPVMPTSLTSTRTAMLIAAGLVLVGFLAFSPALQGGFVNWDDPEYVTENRHVLTGLNRENIVWAFSNVSAKIWLPLTWLSLQVDATVFGPGPFGFHLTNVLLHAINCGLLFWVLRSVTGSTFRSAAAALVWGVHPLRVESVAWVTERKDVLSACFGLLAVLAYARFTRVRTRREQWKWMAVTLGMTVLSLMAKPILFMLPALLLLLDAWPLKRLDRSTWFMRIAEKLPLVVVCVAFAGVAAWAAGNTINEGMQSFPFGQRVANALISTARYLWHMVYPFRLSPFYPYFADWSIGVAVGAGVLLAGITAGSIWTYPRRPWLLVGWAWFLLTLGPVLGLTQAGSQSMADRFVYLPMIGIVIAVAYSLPAGWAAAPQRRLVVGGVTALLAGLLLILSLRQCLVWRDGVSLWTHALAVSAENQIAHGQLGRAYEGAGRADLALPHLVRAVESDPQDAMLRVALGSVLEKLNQPQRAAEQFRIAVERGPENWAALNNYGVVLARQGDFAGALACFTKADRLSGGRAETRDNLVRLQQLLSHSPRP